MLYHTINFKRRLCAWLILVILSLSGFAFLLIQGLPINTNMLALLPGAKESDSIQKTADGFANQMGKQMVILVGNSDQQKALQASDIFTFKLKQSNDFSVVTNEVSTNEQEAWGQFYFPYRLSLLSSSDTRLMGGHEFDKIEQEALSNLYNPMGITNSRLLETDPFSLFQRFILELPKPSNTLELYQNHLMTESDGIWYSMINATLKEGSFSLSNQSKITDLLASTQTEIQEIYPETHYLMTGMIFYAKAGTDSAHHDVSIIGAGSLIGIILLVLMCFRSILPLLLTLFSSAMGFVFAFVVTYLIFGEVFLFTLVFGASLIGISVDYAFFYYADRLYGGKNWDSQSGLKRIFSGITLGLFNVIIAYVIIAVAPFPGLRQLASFAISGLFMSYLTVVSLFPYVLRAKNTTHDSIINRMSSAYLRLWQGLSAAKIILIYLILSIIVIAGVRRLHVNDDIRILESTPHALKSNEQQLKSIIDSDVSTNFVIITGDSGDEVIAHEHEFVRLIKQDNPEIAHPVIAISQYLPDINTQKQNYDLVRNNLLNARLLKFFADIGVDPKEVERIQRALSSISFKPLTVDAWLNSPISENLKFLWMGELYRGEGRAPQFASVVLLSQKLNMTSIKALAAKLAYAGFINKADDISSVFKTYRQYIGWLLILVFAVLFLLLLLRYRNIKKTFCYFIPPTMATLLSLAVFGLFNVPITLFSILALILVLGIAVDYVLFFAETRSTTHSTMLAVALSAITTILSFGLLAFSQTPVIHYFGLAVFVGITSAFLLSPLSSNVTYRPI
ncbi:MMPL family transporter [Caedibacter taeniospiralis]|uniref:MMPL family transporter n=1 Tax=Caedibacter taeniospiralis TaxID=28907 RepID=UPI000C278400|nr:MMPL family transporter [Caedibacter taeniospiralis]